MKMFHIIYVKIGWRDVCTTTEPPNTTISFKVSVVEMHRRAAVLSVKQVLQKDGPGFVNLEVDTHKLT